MKIGILALQGAFLEHVQILRKLGVDSREIRQPADLAGELAGLILPGGESTAMAKLLQDLQLKEPLQKMIKAGLPTFGTCAGMILLAQKVVNEQAGGLQSMDVTVARNAYGRQLGSFTTQADFAGEKNVPMVFIRAPYLTEVSEKVEVLATVAGKIVAARQDNILATAFHPELTADTRVHEYFLKLV